MKLPDQTNYEDLDRCPETGRLFEVGSGALPKAKQSANFTRERDRAADMPKPGERCSKTGRPFECGSGAFTKTMQSEMFVRANLPPSPDESLYLAELQRSQSQ
jgi:hypothetical protein